MTFPASLARRIDKLKGQAHSYACDYAAWWLEGGREPNVDDYIQEEGGRLFNRGRAREIAGFIREAVR